MAADSLNHAQGKVSGPAVALITVCAISIALLLVALVFDVWLLVSDTAGRMRQSGGISKETTLLVRMGWNLLIQATNVVILLGAVRMKSLRSLGLARTACVLALVPCLGPCFVFGIPFGIWGLVVLNDPQVRDSFEG